MNLYLVERKWHVGHGECNSFVAVAANSNVVLKMDPGCDGLPLDPTDLKVTIIGRALRGARAGIIHSSFNAG